jgi:hypothetical protein
MYRIVDRAARSRIRAMRFGISGAEKSNWRAVALFGGGPALLVLKPRSVNSTQTPFLHREGGVETGRCQFNRQQAGGNSEKVMEKMVNRACEKEKKLL